MESKINGHFLTDDFQSSGLSQNLYLADYRSYRPTFHPFLVIYAWVESKLFLVIAIHGPHSILALSVKIKVCVQRHAADNVFYVTGAKNTLNK